MVYEFNLVIDGVRVYQSLRAQTITDNYIVEDLISDSNKFYYSMSYRSTLPYDSLLPEPDLQQLLSPSADNTSFSRLYLQNQDQQGPEHLELFEALLREKDYEHLPIGIIGENSLPEDQESTRRVSADAVPDVNDLTSRSHHQKAKKINKVRKASEGAHKSRERVAKPRKGSLKPRTCFPGKPKQTVGIQQNICNTCSFQNEQMTQRLLVPLTHNEQTDQTSLFPTQNKIEQTKAHSQTASEFTLDFETYLTLN